MNKYITIFFFLVMFSSLMFWARTVIHHLGAAVDAFLIYIIPVLIVAPVVAALIVYLSPNQ